MADVTIKRMDEMEKYTGESHGGEFLYAGKSLGVAAWGMNVVRVPPGWDGYPEHDHSDDGQEEVYVVLRGSGELEIEGERVALDAETLVRVAPGVNRKLWPGGDGIRILIVGGRPGAPYEAPDVTELGAPDPLTEPQH